VTKRSIETCPRPYSSVQRMAGSDRKRAKVLAVARAQLESSGFRDFGMETIARQSGVTRQTIYNLFGSRAGLLEALFDQLAIEGGMQRMRDVMQQTNPVSALASFVDIFCGFWTKDRLLLHRIHGIAAIDPEFGAALEARNQRRKGAASRILQVLDPGGSERPPEEQSERAAALYALTSFEFFDVLAETIGASEAASVVRKLVTNAITKTPASL